VIEQELDIPTDDGAMNSFVVHPEEDGPHPVVLFFMDAHGKREELHDMARRLASVGYYVVVPNLYYRKSRDFWLKVRTPEAMEPMFALMHSLTNGLVVRDTAALLRFVDTKPAALAARVGAVGYCMSGPFVFAAAAQFPDRLQAIAAFHPAQMVTDREDSPHLLAPKVRCETYIGCAETDKWFPPETVRQFQAALDAAGTPYRLEWYPGAEHGFVFPRREGIYHRGSAERHWERVFSLFARRLKV
jgi:carboxymethylenebutenolidase